MAVPIEKKKKTKWYVTLKPLKHVSKFVYGPYFRPKRDFLLPFSDMKWWCPYEAKKCPIPYVGSREHKSHPISDQKGLSLHPISGQKRSKPIPFGATHTVKFRKYSPGLIFFKALFEGLIFGGAYIRRGLYTEGNLRYKIGWASL